MPEVMLVQMPYAAVHHPSIALGLLRSYLAPAGISSRVLYANLLWAEELGLDVYLVVADSFTNDLLGEWTFAAAAFPERPRDLASYRRTAPTSFSSEAVRCLERLHPRLDIDRLFTLVQERAALFVDRLADQVIDSGARIVGCSSMFQQHCAALALLRRIRQKAPEVVTVLGGANCEGPMGAATHRAFPWVDFVCRGEADGYFAAFCADLLVHGRTLPAERLPGGVLGPCHRDGRPLPALDQPPLVADMDGTSVPDYDDYFEALQGSPVGRQIRPGLLMETSRGCWYGARRTCAFCGLNGDRVEFRSKSSGRVLAELSQLSERYRVRHVAAVDNVMDLGYLKQVMPRLAEEGGGYQLFFEVRPNLSRKQLESLASAGVRWVQAGLEHLHDAVLRQVAKGTSALQNVAFLKWARLTGIHVSWNLLSGAPGERDEWYQELASWLPLISHLQPPTGVPHIRYDRFSRYHTEAQSYGLQLEAHPTYGQVYGLSRGELDDLAYFFRDRGPSASANGQVGPALRAAVALICDWRLSFWDRHRASPPMLTMARDGDALWLRDERAIAPTAEVVLRGLEAAVYEQCAEPATPRTLLARLEKRAPQPAEAEVADILEALRARRLLLEQGGRYLALALPEPLSAYPDLRDAPEGYISMNDVLTSGAGTSLARQACRPAWDVPALAAFGLAAAIER